MQQRAAMAARHEIQQRARTKEEEEKKVLKELERAGKEECAAVNKNPTYAPATALATQPPTQPGADRPSTHGSANPPGTPGPRGRPGPSHPARQGVAPRPKEEEAPVHGGGAPPTPDTTAELEKGPWVWPSPKDTPRPGLQRQSSAPAVGVPASRPSWVRMASTSEVQRWAPIPEAEWPAGVMEEPVIRDAKRRGSRRCVVLHRGNKRFRVRVAATGIRLFGLVNECPGS
ncbi:nascent polypeptide-associated complex subunit alpha, muscle-specific form-like [Drosophila yakuba]|uniref:nascent polypeptide-associated complex subunit alpha, muscle-specific form-like n=1 Tax=Drosophila yakuba TaxID=7245 RepID=UPI001930881E|nr:nascent polypeptide-associated complex subunit alpha, muscle-specific form-like [Drosophila yakuba]